MFFVYTFHYKTVSNNPLQINSGSKCDSKTVASRTQTSKLQPADQAHPQAKNVTETVMWFTKTKVFSSSLRKSLSASVLEDNIGEYHHYFVGEMTS